MEKRPSHSNRLRKSPATTQTIVACAALVRVTCKPYKNKQTERNREKEERELSRRERNKRKKKYTIH